MIFLLLVLVISEGCLRLPLPVAAAQPQTAFAPQANVSAYQLISAMNSLRVSNGLPALIEDPIINAVAQATAETMATNQMSWHIGDVSGRLAAAGYGSGAQVWATENFAVGNLTIDEIMVIWADPSHMIPAVNPAYCNVGAGVAKTSTGRYYYVLQAAYVAGKACGAYTSPGGSTSGGSVPQVITPVKIATPDAEGRVNHVVESGQTLWAIAIAYEVTIQDLEIWNNISRKVPLYVGQRLFIPGPDTEGYSTPTPLGMIQVSTPDAEGKLVHTVQEYQTLTTIAKAYDTNVDRILALNRLQADWPLQIGQKLLIDPGKVTPSPSPRPLTPLEMLTPASDGNYYHVVHAGENLSWIAGQYEITVADLITWNGLTANSVLQPDQRLLLQVTPPATQTPTPAPTTATASPTPSAIQATATISMLTPEAQNTASPADATTADNTQAITIMALSLVLALAGVSLFVVYWRKQQ